MFCWFGQMCVFTLSWQANKQWSYRWFEISFDITVRQASSFTAPPGPCNVKNCDACAEGNDKQCDVCTEGFMPQGGGKSCEPEGPAILPPPVKGTCIYVHDDIIKWKNFLRYWPFVWGTHRSPVNSSHKGQWHGALMFSLICAWASVSVVLGRHEYIPICLADSAHIYWYVLLIFTLISCRFGTHIFLWFAHTYICLLTFWYMLYYLLICLIYSHVFCWYRPSCIYSPTCFATHILIICFADWHA